MLKPQIENWVLEILERVHRHQRIEDTAVELKREWIDPSKAARRLAAHANASRGEPILWVIGIDEKEAAVVGATNTELSNWYAQVESFFDGGTPLLAANHNVLDPQTEVTVAAMYFETDAPPYVVKTGEQRVSHEVPWRRGNDTRSARRADLIRLLTPRIRLPEIEVLEGFLAGTIGTRGFALKLHLDLYIVPKGTDHLTIPFHRCEAGLGAEHHEHTRLGDFVISANPDSKRCVRDHGQMIVTGPGIVDLDSSF